MPWKKLCLVVFLSKIIVGYGLKWSNLVSIPIPKSAVTRAEEPRGSVTKEKFKNKDLKYATRAKN